MTFDRFKYVNEYWSCRLMRNCRETIVKVSPISSTKPSAFSKSPSADGIAAATVIAKSDPALMR